MNTPMTVEAWQAETILGACKFTAGLVETFESRDVDHDLPDVEKLNYCAGMARAALLRIADAEARRAGV